MRIFKRLFPTLLAGLLVAGATSGCVVSGRGRTYGSVTYSTGYSPPPPRHVYVDHRPGWVYIDGYWYHNGYDWVWIDGYWERERAGHYYVQGSWYVSGGRHHWKPGYWARGNNGRGYRYQNRNGVVVREHAPNRGGKVHRAPAPSGTVHRAAPAGTVHRAPPAKGKVNRGGGKGVKVRKH